MAAVADAGLRLLCAPEARHLTTVGEPSGWHRPRDRGGIGEGRERKGGQVYDGATVARCSCGWTVTVPPQLGAREMAKRHRSEAAASPAP